MQKPVILSFKTASLRLIAEHSGICSDHLVQWPLPAPQRQALLPASETISVSPWNLPQTSVCSANLSMLHRPYMIFVSLRPVICRQLPSCRIPLSSANGSHHQGSFETFTLSCRPCRASKNACNSYGKRKINRRGEIPPIAGLKKQYSRIPNVWKPWQELLFSL